MRPSVPNRVKRQRRQLTQYPQLRALYAYYLTFTAMHEYIKHLRNCTDHTDLKSQLQLICSRFGQVARLDILIATQAGKRQALCFLRMLSDGDESCLMQELGVGRFGGDIVIVVDLQNPLSEPELQAIPNGNAYEQSQRYVQSPGQHLNA